MTISKTVKLNSGHQMPVLGLGTWRAGPGEVGKAVKDAVKAGYRHIDCAAVYMNEKEIGMALKEILAEGQLKREDLFITSKLWNTHHSHVREACLQTLEDLNLSYLDMYLIHWPFAFKYAGIRLSSGTAGTSSPEPGLMEMEEGITLEQTWRQMEKLVEDGLVKSIGVSNYTIPLILDLVSYANIKPAVNQFEVHPYFTRPSLRRLCRKEGIVITAYSPLGSGKTGPLQDELVTKIAKKHEKSPGQVLIKWSIQSGNVCIPKSSNPKRIKENGDVFEWELTDEEMKALDGLNREFRVCVPRDIWNGFDATEP